MADVHGTAILDQIDQAIGSVPDLALRRIDTAMWERRSAQVWYRITAHTGGQLAPNQVQINIAIILPLLERIVGDLGRDPAYGTIGGNLLQFAIDGVGSERIFQIAPASRMGRVAARLRAPVLGDPTLRSVTEAEFAPDVAHLLETRMAPWVQLTTWSKVAEALATYGYVLAAHDLVDARHRGLQGVLRWATGAHGTGEALIVEAFGAQAPEILARLHDRFAPTS